MEICQCPMRRSSYTVVVMVRMIMADAEKSFIPSFEDFESPMKSRWHSKSSPLSIKWALKVLRSQIRCTFSCMGFKSVEIILAHLILNGLEKYRDHNKGAPSL